MKVNSENSGLYSHPPDTQTQLPNFIWRVENHLKSIQLTLGAICVFNFLTTPYFCV